MHRFIVVLFLISTVVLRAQKPELIPYRKGKLWGYSAPDKQLIIEPKWQESTFFKNGIARVKQEDKWGLIDKNGLEIIPIKYEFISEIINGYVVARLPEPYSLQLINNKGEIRDYGKSSVNESSTKSSQFFTSLILFRGGLMALRNQDRKYGLLKLNGDTVSPFEYSSVRELENDFLIVEKKVEYSFDIKIIKLDPSIYYTSKRDPEIQVDKKNKIITLLITKSELEQLEAMGYDPRKETKTMEFKGLISPKGEVILPPEYEVLKKLSNGLFIIGKDEKMALTNSSGELITPMKYSYIQDFQSGMAAFILDDKSGYLNEEGKEVIPAKYEQAHYFFGEYGMVRKSTGWGFVNKSGKEISSFEYNSVKPFSEGMAAVEKDYRFGYINEEGKEVIPIIYRRELYPFTNGVAILANDVPNGRGELYGMIDNLGNTIVPFRMNEISELSEGMARVMLRTPQGNKKLYGFVDNTGKEVIPIKYEFAEQFKNGQVYVRENRNSPAIYFDKQGNQVEPLPDKRRTLFEAGEDMGNGYVKIYKRTGYGYMSYDKVKYYED